MAHPRAGKVLQGRYRLRSILAEGGMGVVWQAERVGIERPVVVKFLQQVMSDRPGAVDRFEREARATARLNHPNCVQLVDFGLDEGQPYLVVEFVEGQTLAEQLDHGPMAAQRATRICAQVLAGLEHAHERGILHRDLKPANLMIVEATGYQDFVKILDFGLAKIIGEADRREVTVHGVALGTPGYMSPEQAAGMPADLRADIYSVGAVIYHLLTGVKVFEGGNVHSILRKHREDTPPPPRSLRGPGSISAELDTVVSKAMQRDPEKRYQTAAEMRRALEATPEGKAVIAGGQGLTSKRPSGFAEPDQNATRVGRAPRPMPPLERRSNVWPMVLAVSLGTGALGAGGAMVAMHYQGARPLDFTTTTVSLSGDAATTVAEGDVKTVLPPDRVEVRPLVTDAAVAITAAVDASIEPTPEPAIAEVGTADNDSDGADEDVSTAPLPPAAAPRRETRDVSNLGDVRVLMRRGETDLALAGLYQLRRKGGGSRDRQAQIALLIGHLYADRHWVSDALKEYRYALTLDLRLRNDQILINDVVRALGDRVTAARARRVIIDYVGRAAILTLRRTAERSDSRRRAEEVLGKLGAPRR